ncbi:queuine tRNA-ribosyltransferase [Leuconostoc rapi]|uniref:queuine tRNA-ribosyltransferase n=1 Tax=Leuconostoc rapi TaxID=1406906 RepID=UPI00195C84AF|nr:queuine tRNA-ribosyltransferase [Leuconostoc rapi]MBM7436018.1 hypothetical protein [Leuconostoc rapi]
MTVSILIFLYATLTSVALFSAHKQLPAWLTFFNIFAITILYLSILHLGWLVIGLIMLILTAISNALVLNGRVSARHLIIRILFSILVFLLTLA